MDLNLLTALDALLAEASVARAAARLGLSAPAMSRTLARIRRATGDPILVRAGRGLVATPRAHAIRARVRAATLEAHALLSPDPPAALAAIERTLTIRADDAVVAAIGPRLLARVRAEAPGLTVVFRAEGEEDVEALRDGRVDLDVGVQGALGPELKRRKLVDDDRVVLVAAPTRRPRRAITLAQLAAVEHVDVSRRGRLRGPLDELLARHGLVRRVRAVVPTHLAAAALVAGGDVVSLGSRRFAVAARALLPVDFAPPPIALARAAVEAVWHPRLDADRAHRWLREQLAEIGRALAAEAPGAVSPPTRGGRAAGAGRARS